VAGLLLSAGRVRDIDRQRRADAGAQQQRRRSTALSSKNAGSVILNAYGRRAFSVAGPMAWNSLPDFIRGIQRAAQTVLGVYFKRTCSRVTSASSVLGRVRGVMRKNLADYAQRF